MKGNRVMAKICLNTRDEMLIIDLDKIAFFQANGNYTELTYIEGQKLMLSLGLSKVEEYIKKILPVDRPSPFIRLGRSLIINQRFLYSINTLKQKLILSDCANHTYILSISKNLLRTYKEIMSIKYSVNK